MIQFSKSVMKKFILGVIALVPFTPFAQTYSTGLVSLSTTTGAAMSIQLDVANEVTMTLSGPASRWFSIGFNTTGMGDKPDAVTVKSTSPISGFDGKINGYSAPATDAQQNWTIVSDQTTGTVRTVVATRALNTGDAGDYVFSAQTGTLNIIWARGGTKTFSLSNHGGSNRGTKALTFSLVQQANTEALSSENLLVYPNPVSAGETIHVSAELSGLTYTLTDVSGKQVATGTVVTSALTIPADLKAGMYVLGIPSKGSQMNLEIK